MMKENAYKLRASLLKSKYQDIIEEFSGHPDDWQIAINLFGMLTEACRVMESIENTCICVAFNNYFNEHEATMERIASKFTGKVYADHHWTPFDRPVYRVYRLDAMDNFKQDCCTMDREKAVQQMQTNREIGYTSSITKEHPDGTRFDLDVKDGEIIATPAARMEGTPVLGREA